MTTIGVRELKAKTSKLLQEVAGERKEFIITSHGRPCGKLVPVDLEPGKQKNPAVTLRGAYADLPELDYEYFKELKGVWKAPGE